MNCSIGDQGPGTRDRGPVGGNQTPSCETPGNRYMACPHGGDLAECQERRCFDTRDLTDIRDLKCLLPISLFAADSGGDLSGRRRRAFHVGAAQELGNNNT